MRMFKTAVVTSGEVKARVASHFSKVPSRDTEALTPNLIVLSLGVTWKMGMAAVSWDWVAEAKKNNAMRERIIVRTLMSVGFLSAVVKLESGAPGRIANGAHSGVG